MAINIKTEEHILLMEVNRPKKYNAMTQEMYHQMARAYFMLDSDPDARVGLVYAVGPHFTSGLELTDWAGTFDIGKGFPFVAENEIDPFYMMSDVRCRKPIIMAVQGYCYTWGFEMMLNTDIRVAATDTRFGMLEVRRGFFPGAGATLRLPKEIGWGNALRYMLTGDEMSATEAYRIGLVQLLTDPGQQFDKRKRRVVGSIRGQQPVPRFSGQPVRVDRIFALGFFHHLVDRHRAIQNQDGIGAGKAGGEGLQEKNDRLVRRECRFVRDRQAEVADLASRRLDGDAPGHDPAFDRLPDFDRRQGDDQAVVLAPGRAGLDHPAEEDQFRSAG